MIKLLRSFLCLTLCLILFSTNQPLLAAQSTANTAPILTTMDMVDQFDRAETENEIQDYMKTDEAKTLLAQNGFTADEISQKIASLSDSELQGLKSNVEQAQAGGILVAVLLVILIIFFAQRI